MKIYITRHGQVCPEQFFGSVDFPTGDIPLSEKGQIQAKYLGMELKRLGFKGPIFSSPYRRTMMTSDIAAKECGAKVYPDGELREMFFSDEAAQEFAGMNIEKIKEEFLTVAEDAELPYPWWTKAMDNKEIIAKRLKAFWDKYIKLDFDEILVVGHGASLFGSINYFNLKYGLRLPTVLAELADFQAVYGLNCNLSCIEIDNDGKLLNAKLYSTEHLADELLTSNANPKPRQKALMFSV